MSSVNYSILCCALILLISKIAAHPPGYSVNVTLPANVFGEDEKSGGLLLGDNVLRATRGPCTCQDGVCSCCTGVNLAYIGQKGCVNLEYDADDFMFVVSMKLNNKTLYKNVMSGKNPRPFCVPVPRLRFLSMCTKFSNVYLTGRNIHACIDMQGRMWDTELFSMSFDCVKVGAEGVALLSPEDGGGGASPNKPPSGEAVDEDYDDLAPDDYDGSQNGQQDIYHPTPITPTKASTPKSKNKKVSTTPRAKTSSTTTTLRSTTVVTTEKSTKYTQSVEATSPKGSVDNSPQEDEQTHKMSFRRPRE